MPAALLSREEVLNRLLLTFRRNGYDAGSIAQLSKATGLGKSSLYHYFPGGKDEMVASVLTYASEWLEDNVLKPLRSPGQAKTKLKRMVKTLENFYRGGKEACILANMVAGGAQGLFQDRVATAMNAWKKAIARVLIEEGIAPAKAQLRAEDAIVWVQGSLVVSRGMNNPKIFQRVVRTLPDKLLKD